MSIKNHFWQGSFIDDAELESRVAMLSETLSQSTAPLDVEILLDACESLSLKLSRPEPVARRLSESLGSDAEAVLSELRAFISRHALEEKLHRELSLGDSKTFPFRNERINPKKDIFESWQPLGFLVHIAPSNAPLVPFLSVIEGLLCGNHCFVKTSGSDSLFTQQALAALAESDSTEQLKNYLFAARIPSSNQSLLKSVLDHADGVAAWGSEEATRSIRALSPPHARFIEWGHKISLGYVSRERLDNLAIYEAFAKDICELDQQACSSPQVIYFETVDSKTLRECAGRLANALNQVSDRHPRTTPSTHEDAEITQVAAVVRAEAALRDDGLPTYLEGASWKIFIDDQSSLRPSPLFRTIWVKPLERSDIVRTLRPMRMFLQTVGLECDSQSLRELTSAFFSAGALRIMRAGCMLSGYLGEPHDGEYALQRYSRRVSVVSPELPDGIYDIDELARPNGAGEGARHDVRLQSFPLIGKDALNPKNLSPDDAQVYFKSGGSSGEPKLSVFTYADYETQMKLAAHGLFAAGLDPKKDRCMNLFFGGGLYGGFLSFFTILEQLNAVQFPMAAETDYKMVGQWIIRQKINTLLGMPSYLWNLMRENEAEFRTYGGIEKIFYGGEHFSSAQRDALHQHFGVRVIRSASYGSNDVGPIGYQCMHCTGSIHHLHSTLQTLEILRTDSTEPVARDEVGRMILSSKVRRGQHLTRYEIGDLGRWIEEPCPCGRSGRRFELLGRYGDVFRIATNFMNYRQFSEVLSAFSGFSGEFQLVLESESAMTLKISSSTEINIEQVRAACIHSIADLADSIHTNGLDFKVARVDAAHLERSGASGKLRSVVDLRRRA